MNVSWEVKSPGKTQPEYLTEMFGPLVYGIKNALKEECKRLKNIKKDK